ncbi:MAG: hypothetical protein ACRBF0_21185 [Calditrichia bacterium]
MPIKVRQAETRFIQDATGQGVRLFAFITLMVVALIALGTYSLWIVLPAIALFTFVFFRLLSIR